MVKGTLPLQSKVSCRNLSMQLQHSFLLTGLTFIAVLLQVEQFFAVVHRLSVNEAKTDLFYMVADFYRDALADPVSL